jgi:hypothetical protein
MRKKPEYRRAEYQKMWRSISEVKDLRKNSEETRSYERGQASGANEGAGQFTRSPERGLGYILTGTTRIKSGKSLSNANGSGITDISVLTLLSDWLHRMVGTTARSNAHGNRSSIPILDPESVMNVKKSLVEST